MQSPELLRRRRRKAKMLAARQRVQERIERKKQKEPRSIVVAWVLTQPGAESGPVLSSPSWEAPTKPSMASVTYR
jgi:aryl-alcohol dehydrogenase-like predicted oxidoreductase